MKKIISLLFALLLFAFYTVSAQEASCCAAAVFQPAPIGIMGSHLHGQGEFMAGYRYMPMWMSGNHSGTDQILDQTVLETYMAVPTRMQMHMHMLEIMYAPTDWLTLMVMGNFRHSTMDMRNRMDLEFSTASAGIGDLTLSGLIRVINSDRHSIHANAGLSIPTGSIRQRDDTPFATDMKLPYVMQLGSGSVDPFAGFTYHGTAGRFYWGVQPIALFRFMENSEGYTLGNRTLINGWGGVSASEFLAFTARVEIDQTGKITGADPALNPMMSPPANSANSGKDQLNLYAGISGKVSKGPLKGLMFGLEAGYPMYQKMNGIQMDQRFQLVAGIQYAFGKKACSDHPEAGVGE
jgi:hypothetical protein